MPAATQIPSPRVSAADLNELITLLEIRVLGLSECLVSQGSVLELDGNDAPGIHYILSGEGLLHIAGAETVPLAPHHPDDLPGKRMVARCDTNGFADAGIHPPLLLTR